MNISKYLRFGSISLFLLAPPVIGCSDGTSSEAGNESETGDGDGDTGDGDGEPGDGDGDTGDEAPGDGDTGDGDGDTGDGDGDTGDGDGDAGDGDGDAGDGDGDAGDGDGDAGDGDGDTGDGDPGDGDGDTGEGDTDGEEGRFTEEDCLDDFSAEAWWSVALHDGANGDVQPAQEDIDFVALHMCWLRLANPQLNGVVQYQAWEDDTMFADLIPNAPTDGYEALKLQYGVITDEQPFMILPNLHLLTFSQPYNMLAMAKQFEALNEVNYADPNDLIGGQRDRYEYQDHGNGMWRWFIYDEFWDCFDGCDCVRTWSYDIDHDAGTVTPVSYSEQGQPWCEF